METVQRTGDMYWFNRESLPAAERQRYYRILRSMHDASVFKNDLLLRSLISALKSYGLYDDTLIIISADHGEFLGERDLISHGMYLYEESVRVPLLIKFPGTDGPRGRADRIVSTIDLVPTIMELATGDTDRRVPEWQGMSLLGQAEHEFVISQRRNFERGIEFWRRKRPDHSFEQYDYGHLVSFKTRTHKFVWSSKGRHSLFDLIHDPGEMKNIYGDDATSRGYLERCEQWKADVPRVGEKTLEEFDEKVKRHLRGLGYIEQ